MQKKEPRAKCVLCEENIRCGPLLCNKCSGNFKTNYDVENKPKFHDHLLEQYKYYSNTVNKMYELKDKYNIFYFSILSGLLALLVIIAELQKNIPINKTITNIFTYLFSNFLQSLILIVLALSIGVCIIWCKHIFQFTKLNRVKYQIIKEIEKNLPYPIFRIEKNALDKVTYIKMLEYYTPIIFASSYLLFLWCFLSRFFKYSYGSILIIVLIFVSLTIVFIFVRILIKINKFQKEEINEYSKTVKKSK